MNDRRLFLQLLGVAILNCLSSRYNTALAASSFKKDLSFYAGRAGRFGYEETPTVIVGGLLATNDVTVKLESKLEKIAQEMKFHVPLHFSTNKYNLEFYKEAIKAVFLTPEVTFSGFRVSHKNWPKEPAVWEYWRQELETNIFSQVIKDKHLRIYTLKHDFNSDKRIYRSVKEVLPNLSDVTIYETANSSPRLMQLSGVLAKCLNSQERLSAKDAPYIKNGNHLKNALVRETFSAFDISRINEDIVKDSLVIKNITI